VQLSVPGAAPVLGSWSPEEPGATGELTTSWFALPAPGRRTDAPLVVAAAGPLGGGNELALEFAAGERLLRRVDLAEAPAVTATADPSGAAAEGRGWRDLRIDLTDLPAEVDRARLVAEDRNLSPEGWLAVTPPRVPRLTPLTELVGDAPGFLDWPVAFPHPCLRPFDVSNGVAELPQYRVLADPQQRAVGDTWSSPPAGGPQAWVNELARQRVVPTYLEGEWGRDWGQLRLLQPYVPQATGPDVVVGQRRVWGLEDPGPIGAPPAGRPTDAR
jgi:arabinosyltransferase C